MGGFIRPLNEHMNLHFDRDFDILMSSKHHEENGYGLALISCFLSYEKWVYGEKRMNTHINLATSCHSQVVGRVLAQNGTIPNEYKSI